MKGISDIKGIIFVILNLFRYMIKIMRNSRYFNLMNYNASFTIDAITCQYLSFILISFFYYVYIGQFCILKFLEIHKNS